MSFIKDKAEKFKPNNITDSLQITLQIIKIVCLNSNKSFVGVQKQVLMNWINGLNFFTTYVNNN